MPAYHELSTGQVYRNFVVELSEPLSCNHGGAGSGAAGGRFADTALVHAQIDARLVVDDHEADIGTGRKAAVVLYQRTELRHVGGINVSHLQYAMRIAHGQYGDVEHRAFNVNRISIALTIGDERDTGGVKLGRSHADRDAAVSENTRLYRPGRTLQPEYVFGFIMSRQHPRNAANAVSALLDFRTVRIEDTVTRGHRCIACRSDPHELIEAGPGAGVTQFPKLFSTWRRTILAALIHYQNLVSGAVHLKEGQVHRRSVSGAPHALAA